MTVIRYNCRNSHRIGLKHKPYSLAIQCRRLVIRFTISTHFLHIFFLFFQDYYDQTDDIGDDNIFDKDPEYFEYQVNYEVVLLVCCTVH